MAVIRKPSDFYRYYMRSQKYLFGTFALMLALGLILTGIAALAPIPFFTTTAIPYLKGLSTIQGLVRATFTLMASAAALSFFSGVYAAAKIYFLPRTVDLPPVTIKTPEAPQHFVTTPIWTPDANTVKSYDRPIDPANQQRARDRALRLFKIDQSDILPLRCVNPGHKHPQKIRH